MKPINLGIVGATGLVGRTFLKVLEEYHIPIQELRLFASFKSNGKMIPFQKKDYVIHTLYEGCFKGLDYVLFSAGTEISRQWAYKAVKENATVIDNSACFRMKEGVLLLVPEINMDDKKIDKPCLIANPNCSTIQSVLCLNALKSFHLKRVIYNTYQAVSGSGQKGILDLLRCRNNKIPLFYEEDISYTCIPKIGNVLENHYTSEEIKMMEETKKILEDDQLEVVANCVRVPVMFGHGVSILAEFEKQISVKQAMEALKKQPGVVVLEEDLPTSILATSTDFVYVGRIRKDLSKKNSIFFYCVADNVRRGAASNAVLILKKLIYNDNDKGR